MTYAVNMNTAEKRQKNRKIALVIIAALLLALVVLVIIPRLFMHFNTLSLESEVSNARQQAGASQRSAVLQAKEKVAALGKTTDADIRSSVDACYLAHNDAGWTIESWYQTCYFRDLQLFETSLSQTELQTLLEAPVGCAAGVRIGTSTLRYIAANSKVCSIPNQVYSDSVVVYARSEESFISKKALEFDASKIDTNKNYLVAETEKEYFSKNLGCLPLSFMCEQPVSGPRFGK